MKLQEDYSIITIAGNSFLIPIGASIVNVGKIMDLNDTSLCIVNVLKECDVTLNEIVDKVFNEFEEDKEIIRTDTIEFINKGIEMGFIVE